MNMNEFFPKKTTEAIVLGVALAASPNLNAENVVDKQPEESKNKIEYQENTKKQVVKEDETTVHLDFLGKEKSTDIERKTPRREEFIEKYKKSNPKIDTVAFNEVINLIDSAKVDFKYNLFYSDLQLQLVQEKSHVVNKNLLDPKRIEAIFAFAKDNNLDPAETPLFEAENFSEVTKKQLELFATINDSLTKEDAYSLVTSELFRLTFLKEGSLEEYCNFVKQDIFTDFTIKDFEKSQQMLKALNKSFPNKTSAESFFSGTENILGNDIKFEFNDFDEALILYKSDSIRFNSSLKTLVSLKKRTVDPENVFSRDSLASGYELKLYNEIPERFISLYETTLINSPEPAFLSPYALPRADVFKICLDYFSSQPYTTLTNEQRRRLITTIATCGKVTSPEDIYSILAVSANQSKVTETPDFSFPDPELIETVIKNLNKKEFTELKFERFYVQVMLEIHPILNTILNNLQRGNVHEYINKFLEDPLFTKIDFKKFSQYYEEINPLKTGASEAETNDLNFKRNDDLLVTVRNLVSLGKEVTKENVKFTYELLVQTRKDSVLMSNHVIKEGSKVAVMAHSELETRKGSKGEIIQENRFGNNDFLDTYRKLTPGGVAEIRDTSSTVDPVVSAENFKRLKEEILSIVEGNKNLVVVDDGHGFARGLEMKSGGYEKGEVITASDILEAIKRNSAMNKESRLTFIFNACEAASFVTGNGGIQDTIMNHNKNNPTNQLPLPIIITQGEIGQPTWSNSKVPTFNELTEFFKKGNPTYQDLVNFNLEYFKTTRSNLTFWVPMKVMIKGKWVEVYFQLASNIEADEYSNVG